ncbi:MAG: hypothetical protein KBF89_05080 [Acidimicrobiia bacterium]|nr:hypothetical protein [Acidimicrobiia bacterium]
MNENFKEILIVGGKSNSLGRVNDVIEIVLANKARLDELYNCLFEKDPWLRMRAADALEKICRINPDWFQPYIKRFLGELTVCTQASIQWHMAQIFRQVKLTKKQKLEAITWLKALISTKDVDWIVSANTMITLFQFTQDGSFSNDEMRVLLKIQQSHKSNAVIKRANKFLTAL